MIQVIGAFDGFHKGHQLLLKEAERLSVEQNDTWGVVTFTPHPQYVFNPDRLFLLFTEAEKRQIASALHIQNILWMPFDQYIAALNPLDFLRRLESQTSVTGIVVGENFRFGAGRKGDIAFFTAILQEEKHSFLSCPNS
jgi:riboflavin kinase/FMN adenylyltransferase